MPSPAQAINAQYALIEGRIDVSRVQDLKWPEDKRKIAQLTIFKKQCWYAAQDPHALMELGGDFQKWWRWNYLLPLKLKRLAYKLKFW